ncbi:hypothetical protein FOL47_005684 [Perkinsus chesapeaki]|uniref:FAD-binding PCMH-type domain-containing protein n=1 Tax=Perkinsus chesapeaki TaxID=330153 RepID=A0A7J6LWB9_PERCH|nr:hypothetical protein FOL47_005684 [Perkinsus chesapeaki]
MVWFSYILAIFSLCAVATGDVQSAVSRLISALPGQVQTTDIPPPYNERFDQAHGYSPAAMVNVTSADDIIAALQICHEEVAPVAIRSNQGSSYIGQSTVNNGIVIDLERLTGFSVSEVNGDYIASMGAGLRLLEAYSRLARHDPPLGLAAGSGPTVGIAGLLSGGGHGLSSAKYGITADRLVSADVVVYNESTGKFELVTATGFNEHSDLFFALRGGMGGNYGVIVTLRYKAFPVTNVVVISGKSSDVNPSLQAQRIKAFQTFMHSSAAGPEMFGIGKFLGGGAIQFSAQCICDASGDCSSCQGKVQALADSVGVEKYSILEQSFGEAMWFWADCTAASWMDFYPPDGVQKCSESELKKSMNECWDWNTHSLASPYKAKSLYFDKDIDIATLETMAELSLDPICKWNTDCVLQFDFYGHAMAEEPKDCDAHSGRKCTAFDHRVDGWHLQMIASWYPDQAPPQERIQWLHKAYSTVLPVSLHQAYQNYIDSDLSTDFEWIDQYFPNSETYARLQQVKCKYNSIDMFAFPSIKNMTIQIDDEICGRKATTTTTPFATTITTTPSTTTTTTTPFATTTTPSTTTATLPFTTITATTTTTTAATTSSYPVTTTSTTSTTPTTGMDCSMADAICAEGYPGSYCKIDQYPPVCWGSNVPCQCSGGLSTSTTQSPTPTSGEVTTQRSTTAPDCHQADLQCSKLVAGSYCMYWKSPSLCWGSDVVCTC